jgi:hypothetical protein
MRMNPSEIKDLGSTIAGGGAGLALLLTVRWEATPFGEAVKVVVALTLLLMGYVMYLQKPRGAA